MARKSDPILDNLQTVPSIEDTNITKAMLPANKAIVICYLEHGRMQDLPRGGPTSVILSELHAVKRLVAHGVAMRVLGGGGGSGACSPEKWYNLVHYGAYFHKFLLKKGAIYNVKYSLFTQESVIY